MRKLVKVILVIFALATLFGTVRSNTVDAFNCDDPHTPKDNLCP